MAADSPLHVVRSFVDRINAHDVEGLTALMTDDHVFIDALGARTVGRDAMRLGWKSYLDAFPDYEVTVDEWVERDDVVGLFGTARGTYAGDPAGGWATPAAWKARVRDGLVAEWRAFCDTESMRTSLE